MARTPSAGRRAPAVVLAATFLFGCGDSMPGGIDKPFGFSALVFVSRPLPAHAGSLAAPDRYRPGGNLQMIEPAAPGGKVTRLTDLTEGDVLGVDMAPDGASLVAAIRTGPSDRFHLYSVDLERVEAGDVCMAENGDLGPACTRMTFGPANDTRPFHLPDGRVAFLREDPDGPVDYRKRGRSRVLMAVEPDGSSLARLDTGPGHVLGAGALRSGWLQLVRATERGGSPVYLPAWIDPSGTQGIEPDGCCGQLGEVPLGPVQSEQGSLYAACVPLQGTWGAGTICMRDATGWQNIVPVIPHSSACSPEGRVRDPHPLKDGRFLVTYAKVPEGCTNLEDGDRGLVPDIGIAVLDPVSGKRVPVTNSPLTADVDPRPVLGRTLLDPGVELNKLQPCQEGGVVYQGFIGSELVQDGAARMRVIEFLSGEVAPWMMELGGSPGGAICTGDQDEDGTMDKQEAPIFADGSFRLRAPSSVPLRLEVVDHYGATLAFDPVWRGGSDCSVRSCETCHANGGDLAGFEQSLAQATETLRLDGPPDTRRSFNFRKDIQPILNKCATSGCHDAATASGSYVTLDGQLRGLDLSPEARGRTTVSYQNLLFLDRVPASGKIRESRRAYVVPGQAAQSQLVQRLGVPCRFDCSAQPAWAPWGTGEGATHPENHPGFTGSLSPQERWTIVDWIDSGAPFHGRGAKP